MDRIKRARLAIPYIDLSVPAGFPSPAGDYAEERINLNEFLIQHPESTFIVRCEGDSMINAFISPKCYLVVDRSLDARNGDIVLAHVSGRFTVKYLQKNDYRCLLAPANSKYKEIDITNNADALIWGVVTSIITNPREL